MKINIENIVKIERALEEAQGKARVRKIHAYELSGLAERADKRLIRLGLPIRLEQGAQITVGYEPMPRAYNYIPMATIVTLTKGTGQRWFLTYCEREACDKSEQNNGLTLTEEQREYLKRQIDRNYM